MLADADPRFLDCSHTEHNGADKTFREHIEEQKMAQGPPRVLQLFNHEGIIRSCAFIPFNFNGDVHRLLWATGRILLTPYSCRKLPYKITKTAIPGFAKGLETRGPEFRIGVTGIS